MRVCSWVVQKNANSIYISQVGFGWFGFFSTLGESLAVGVKFPSHGPCAPPKPGAFQMRQYVNSWVFKCVVLWHPFLGVSPINPVSSVSSVDWLILKAGWCFYQCIAPKRVVATIVSHRQLLLFKTHPNSRIRIYFHPNAYRVALIPPLFIMPGKMCRHSAGPGGTQKKGQLVSLFILRIICFLQNKIVF